MNRKGSNVLAIVFLVIATVVLVGFSLQVFLTKGNGVSMQIESASLPERIYAHAEQINFYVSKITERAASGVVNDGNAKSNFITEFKKELESYKIGEGSYIVPEFNQIGEQLDVSKINIENGEIVLTLKFKVEGAVSEKGLYDIIHGSYVYEKKFRGKMKIIV